MVERQGMNPERQVGAGRLLVAALVLALAAAGCSKRPAGGADEAVEPGLHVRSAQAWEYAGQMVFPLILEPARSTDVVVSYQTTPAPPQPDPALASPGEDFTAAAGQVTIKAGETRGSISIPIHDDDIYERSERFGVVLTGAAGAEISTASAEGTILDNDPRPVASLEFTGDTTIPEQFGEKRSLTIALDRPSSLDSVLLIRHDPNGSNPRARPRVDYVLSQGGQRLSAVQTELTIPAGQTTLASPIELEVVDDGLAEGREDVVLALFSPPADGQAAADVDIHATNGSVALSITDNDVPAQGEVTRRQLNDTGVTARYENAESNFPGQQDGDLDTPFSFTKLDAAGNALPDDATSWDCVRDNVTGLTWEVKQPGSGLRGAERKFRWYDPDERRNGGVAGLAGSEVCDDVSSLPSGACNMQYYAADMNLIQLCGRTGWRVPTLEELRSLADYSTSSAAINPDYFPNEPTRDKNVLAALWTSQTYVRDPRQAWVMRFQDTLPLDGVSSKTDLAGTQGRNFLRLVTEDTGG